MIKKEDQFKINQILKDEIKKYIKKIQPKPIVKG